MSKVWYVIFAAIIVTIIAIQTLKYVRSVEMQHYLLSEDVSSLPIIYTALVQYDRDEKLWRLGNDIDYGVVKSAISNSSYKLPNIQNYNGYAKLNICYIRSYYTKNDGCLYVKYGVGDDKEYDLKLFDSMDAANKTPKRSQ